MSRLAARLSAGWALCAGALVILIMAVTTVNVAASGADRVARLLGGSVSGVLGYEDFVRLMISCAALMFLPYTQFRRGHVAVDLFVSKMSASLRARLEKTWLVVTVLTALFLAYWMILGMLETRSDQALSRVLGWPEWPFYLPGVLSLLLWAFVAGTQLLEKTDDA